MDFRPIIAMVAVLFLLSLCRLSLLSSSSSPASFIVLRRQPSQRLVLTPKQPNNTRDASTYRKYYIL